MCIYSYPNGPPMCNYAKRFRPGLAAASGRFSRSLSAMMHPHGCLCRICCAGIRQKQWPGELPCKQCWARDPANRCQCTRQSSGTHHRGISGHCQRVCQEAAWLEQGVRFLWTSRCSSHCSNDFVSASSLPFCCGCLDSLPSSGAYSHLSHESLEFRVC